MKTLAQIVVTALLLAAARAAPAADPPPRAAPPAEHVKRATPPARPAAQRTVDRLQLDATSITGNRELPKVMSIVPWKAAEPPGGPDRPMGSLIEEVLAPVDRDEFRREITYYRDVTSHSSPVVPGATQP